MSTEFDHFNIVLESMTGSRATDEKTFSSIAVLAERLEKVKKLGGGFEGIEFSPELGELASREMISAIS